MHYPKFHKINGHSIIALSWTPLVQLLHPSIKKGCHWPFTRIQGQSERYVLALEGSYRTDEAEKINRLAKNFDTDYLKYVGGIYSSEWFWAKLWHAVEVDKNVANACHSWVEHCDWFPFLLTGCNVRESNKKGCLRRGS